MQKFSDWKNFPQKKSGFKNYEQKNSLVRKKCSLIPPCFLSYQVGLPSDIPQKPPYILVQIRDLGAVPSDLSRVRYPA
jgi:hypothetical protein